MSTAKMASIVSQPECNEHGWLISSDTPQTHEKFHYLHHLGQKFIQFTVLVVNYGISNTVVLEIP